MSRIPEGQRHILSVRWLLWSCFVFALASWLWFPSLRFGRQLDRMVEQQVARFKSRGCGVRGEVHAPAAT